MSRHFWKPCAAPIITTRCDECTAVCFAECPKRIAYPGSDECGPTESVYIEQEACREAALNKEPTDG
jgi:hypothetical protein